MSFGEARYTEGCGPGTSKQIQRTISGKTQREATQKLKAATSAIDAGTYISPSKMTVGDWLDIWTADYLGGVKPFTVASYKGHVKNHIKPAMEAIRGHRYEALFTITLFTGMRQGEVLGLMWDCVDFDRGTILIDKQLHLEKKRGGQYVFASLKNDKARTIAPTSWVMQVLRRCPWCSGI